MEPWWIVGFVAFILFYLVLGIINRSRAKATDRQIEAGVPGVSDTRVSSDMPPGGDSLERAMLCVMRPRAFVAAANAAYVYLDDTPVTKVKNGTYVVLAAPTGHHIVTSGLGHTTELDIVAGTRNYVSLTGLGEVWDEARAQGLLPGLTRVSDSEVNAHFRADPGMDPLTTASGSASVSVVAGWYPDPTSRNELRYWTGQEWAMDVSNGGEVTADSVD